MTPKIGIWFREIWGPNKRQLVAGDYLSLGATHQLFLADIGLRGYVFSDPIVRGDTHATYLNLGRRELALEVITLAGLSPDQLFALIEKAPLRESKVG